MVLQSDFVFILLDFGLTMMGRGFFWWHEGSSRLIIIVFTMVELSIVEVAILFSEISAETESTCLRSSVGWIFVVFLDELLLLPLGYYIISFPLGIKTIYLYFISLISYLTFFTGSRISLLIMFFLIDPKTFLFISLGYSSLLINLLSFLSLKSGDLMESSKMISIFCLI